jgi:hypothetical protein
MERLCPSDPTLSGPEARLVFEEDAAMTELYLGSAQASTFPDYARRYRNLSRTLTAQLQLIRHLDGAAPPEPSWMSLTLDPNRVTLTVELDDGPKTITVDR